MKPGDRIGIIGANGSGKSSLLNMLAGKISPDSGEIEVGQTVKIAYYTQENEEMNLNQRMIEYIKEIAEVIHTTDGKVIGASQMLERFLFHRIHMVHLLVNYLAVKEDVYIYYVY